MTDIKELFRQKGRLDRYNEFKQLVEKKEPYLLVHLIRLLYSTKEKKDGDVRSN